MTALHVQQQFAAEVLRTEGLSHQIIGDPLAHVPLPEAGGGKPHGRQLLGVLAKDHAAILLADG
jgi:hypothetical protein